MPGRRIRVLPDDEDTHAVEGLRERAQHVRPLRQVAATRGQFGAEEVAHRGDARRHGLEGRSPARVDELREGLRAHAGYSTGPCADHGNAIHFDVRRHT